MTDRDQEMLKLVLDFRFLRSDLIYHLIDEDGQTSRQNLLRRLQKLYHHGFLDRPKEHQVTQYKGSEKIVYAIGDKGHDYLFSLGLTDRLRGRWSWTTKNREVKYPHIEHTLMVANFYTLLSLALRENPAIELVEWEILKRKVEDQFEVSEKGRRVRKTICPDAFFVLEDAEGLILYCLEADQSTMSHRRVLEKYRKYWQWKFHAKRAKPRFGSDKIIILSITPSEERRDNLRQVARQADDKRIGSEYFWFASQTDYSPEDPQSILAPIWYTPLDNKPHRLLE